MSPWFVLALGFGLVHSAPALAIESVTVTPPADAIEGNPFTLTVSTTQDSASTTTLRVFARQDDGSPCQASASAVKAASPQPVELFNDHRRAAPVTVDVPAQSFVGGLRVCAFVELVPAPQTTLSMQDLVIPIRAPIGTLEMQAATASPFFGQSFAVHVQGTSEAASGTVVVLAQRGPCAPSSASTVDALGGTAVSAGANDTSVDVTIDGAVKVVPDRVCAWLYASGGTLLASAEQPITLSYDGSLVVSLKHFVTRKQHGRVVAWFLHVSGHTSGDVSTINPTLFSGGHCIAGFSQRKGSTFVLGCTLSSRPRRPFVFELSYLTGLGVRRSTGKVTVAVPKPARRRRH